MLLEELSRVETSSDADAGGACAAQNRTGVTETKDVTKSGPGHQVQHSGVSTSRGPDLYSKLPSRGTACPAARTAPAQELDAIMNELLGLGTETPEPPPLVQKSGAARPSVEEKKAGAGEPVKPRSTDAIDDLLGGLNADMEKMGIRTTAKGHCAGCGKCIVGKILTALGQVWHPEHFVCVTCHKELGSGGFFERNGNAYCEKDYQERFSPRCAYCKGPILNNILNAMDRTWHPEHFFCTHCGDLFGTEGFLEKDGKPYCTKDFYLLFAPKCSGCSRPVKENYLTAANGTWHPECFVCADCLQPFTEGSFHELDGRPLCYLHFHSRQGTLCGGCGAPISGRCISALGRKFHPEHFLCAFCLRQLNQGVFKEHDGKPYCPACHGKLFM
uniref:LIM zinc-binding domain-containing protein n=2 Tax=Denticeps clupeoides TaxID=299321 RepID=A0AAY4E1I2_9TELE